MSNTFFIPAVNIMGIGCMAEAMTAIHNFGLRKALIVTDAGLAKAGVADTIVGLLAAQDIDALVFDGTKPNPTVANVERPGAVKRRASRSWGSRKMIFRPSPPMPSKILAALPTRARRTNCRSKPSFATPFNSFRGQP